MNVKQDLYRFPAPVIPSDRFQFFGANAPLGIHEKYPQSHQPAEQTHKWNKWHHGVPFRAGLLPKKMKCCSFLLQLWRFLSLLSHTNEPRFNGL